VSSTQVITIDDSERQCLFDAANLMEGAECVADFPPSLWALIARKLTAIGERPGLEVSMVVEKPAEPAPQQSPQDAP
jgi:hypothetical protein